MSTISSIACGCILLFAIAGSAGAQESVLVGQWTSEDHKTIVELVPCKPGGSAVCATVLSDAPNPGERSRAGETIGINFVPGANGTWIGQILAEDGTPLAATLSMPFPNQLDMRVCFMPKLCDKSSYYRADRSHTGSDGSRKTQDPPR